VKTGVHKILDELYYFSMAGVKGKEYGGTGQHRIKG
jgi:hypothetical protein